MLMSCALLACHVLEEPLDGTAGHQSCIAPSSELLLAFSRKVFSQDETEKDKQENKKALLIAEQQRAR